VNGSSVTPAVPMFFSNAKYCSQAVMNVAGVTVPPGVSGRLTLVPLLQSNALLSEYPPGYSSWFMASTGPIRTFLATATWAAVRQFFVRLAEHSTELRLNFSSQAWLSRMIPTFASHALMAAFRTMSASGWSRIVLPRASRPP